MQTAAKKLHFCIVYDCLYPYTIGGAERWYRHLVEILAQSGHQVTYLTRNQWEGIDAPEIPGVRVIAVSPQDELYDAQGQRRFDSPLRFAFGVFKHIIKNRKQYDVVHSGSFPFFPLLAARTALIGTDTLFGVDWHEVWSKPYWQSYSGRNVGQIGCAIQNLCILVSSQTFVFSEMNRNRLLKSRVKRAPIKLSGLYSQKQPLDSKELILNKKTTHISTHPTVVYAGRHIPEKRPHIIPGVVSEARNEIPDLRGIIFGDGPDRKRVLQAIEAENAKEFIDAPGFERAEVVEDAIKSALCLVFPSTREGYGMIVLEAAALGTPVIVVAGKDNGATELIIPGVNGYVAKSPTEIPTLIVKVFREGPALKKRTRQWFSEHKAAFQISSSAEQVESYYIQRSRFIR